MKTYFKEFNEEFFKGSEFSEIRWFDREGVYHLYAKNSFYDFTNLRVVRITLEDQGTRDHFNGYSVEVLSNTQGLLAKKFFRFEHYLEMIHRTSSDKTLEYYHAWLRDGKLDWYMSRPKDTIGMCTAIFEWVNFFK
jgi:hypothetical protein